jgi:thymidine phosphorylase
MAVFFRGLNPDELAALTKAMRFSGETFDATPLHTFTVDKHSTGGVGDKTSLLIAPILAASGLASPTPAGVPGICVPMISGRSLGHTGGTLDKLESIPGWRAHLSNEEIVRQLDQVGAVICAAGEGLAPADRKLYALRDVTATVESIPLIAASIMSKKIAEGTASLVLDVKVGVGAFMKDRERAGLLARTMVGLGNDHGVSTMAMLTDMDTPLGRAAGNGLEVTEAVEVLQGGGPGDVVEVTVALALEMLALAGITGEDPAARLRDGSAYAVYREMIAAQGGDPDATMPVAPVVEPVVASRSGTISRMDALAVGVAAWRLGAGRARKEDAVSAAAGVVCLVKPGDGVEAGQPILELHADSSSVLDRAREALDGAVDITDGPVAPAPLVLDRIYR